MENPTQSKPELLSHPKHETTPKPDSHTDQSATADNQEKGKTPPNIETVTPDTEKDGLPNDQKHNHQPDIAKADEQRQAETGEVPKSDSAEH